MAKDPQALTPEQQEEAIRLLREGKSQWATAKAIGCSVPTIHRLAKLEGISTNVSATQQALQAKREYDQANRLALLNKFFDRADEWLDFCESPSQFQSLTLSVAVLVDKRRLEDGEATNRTETNTGEARHAIAEKLERLAKAWENKQRAAADVN